MHRVIRFWAVFDSKKCRLVTSCYDTRKELELYVHGKLRPHEKIMCLTDYREVAKLRNALKKINKAEAKVLRLARKYARKHR